MCRTLLILTVVFCLLTCTRGGLAARKESAAADQFWTTERLHTIHIRITDKQWQVMQPAGNRKGRDYLVASAMPRPSTRPATQPVLIIPTSQLVAYREGQRLEPNFYGMQFAYVKATFECDGVAVKDVGFRQRGNSSFNWGASSYKRPYKIDFNRFVDGQKFLGLACLYLNNNAYDPSLLRETLGYEVFRTLGVPAPRTTFALVYLSIEGRCEREYVGLYTLIEPIDSKAFLKDRFGSAKGMLMKPWSIRGLPYMGEQWNTYESHYNSRTPPTPATARRTIDFIKLINYADDETFRRQIDGYLNVDEFLRLLAGYVILSNLDCPLYTGHNFYMYLNPKDDRFYLMPWDLNLSFANFTSAAPIEPALHLSIMHPHSGEAKIIDRLLAIPQYNQMYRNHIAQFLSGYFNPERLFPRIDSLQGIMAQAETAADAAWEAKHRQPATRPSTRPVKVPPRPKTQLMGWQGQPAIPLKAFVTRRIQSLKAQLAGETEGFTPGGHRPPVPPRGGLHASRVYGNLPWVTVFLMRAADSNYDSKLTGPEFMAAVREGFAKADMSHQNALNSPALMKVMAGVFQQLAQQQRNNADKKRPPTTQPDPTSHWARAIFQVVDQEKTGKLTLAQAVSAAERAFAQADKDKSGKLDESELLELLDTIAAASPPPTTPPATKPTPKPATRPLPRPATKPAKGTEKRAANGTQSAK
ncbi:MAG: CotH kinase family protein [Bacillota bacterium]